MNDTERLDTTQDSPDLTWAAGTYVAWAAEVSYTDGGLTFLGTWRLEIDENGNLGEVKED